MIKHFLTAVEATHLDLPQLVDIINGAYRGESSRQGWTTEADFLDGQRIDLEMLEALLKKARSRLLVAKDSEGQIRGSVHIESLEEFVTYLGMLTVNVAFQAAGVGSFLVTAAEEYARVNFGATKMEMTVLAQRPELIAWYERRGYRVTGEKRPFPYGDERFGKPRRPDLYFEVLNKML